MKLQEAIHHRIYTVYRSKYANVKRLRTIYFPVCSITLICRNSTLLQDYTKFQRHSVVIYILFHYPFNARVRGVFRTPKTSKITSRASMEVLKYLLNKKVISISTWSWKILICLKYGSLQEVLKNKRWP